MSDRFRFRAWISCEGKFSDSVCVFADGSFRAGLHTCEDYEIVYLEDEAILMQCTGLKDKNGVLIYEGDVIRKGDSTGAVIWDNGDWAVTHCRNMLFAQRGKIIGNIHEHPELVED